MSQTQIRKERKLEKGFVVGNKMEKTVVVRVQRLMRHPRYNKVIKVNKKFYAHCDQKIDVGTPVTIMETRPLSKLKRWRVVDVGVATKGATINGDE